MDVHITEGDAAYEHHAAMRFLIAGTATMNQRIRSKLILLRDMNFHAMNCSSRSYAHCVALNKRYDKYASTVVYAWESISVKCASSLMMMSQNSSITAMRVEYVELVAGRISFTAQNA
ncbi:uncharacterized protein LOC119276984 isoform X3 [Triticum dicoccoides]|uniref:uncharacterized protein LOC119276984 isoform X3 n=1 Tax=Triticum dicoccoides TaxID=85692 RepID=UPI00188F0A2D|nr:uncharacterized protein LOC119276984 isoform X3 [Triticum dicoccoides]